MILSKRACAARRGWAAARLPDFPVWTNEFHLPVGGMPPFLA
jgi:hypothetical protein